MRLVTAREQFEMLSPWRHEAMADTTPWQSKIHHYPSPDGTGSYSVYDQGDQLGQLMYKRDKTNPVIHVDHLWTDEAHQGKGVAQSLMERLHQDHPEHKINTGETTQEGTAFTQRLLDTNPEHRDILDNPERFASARLEAGRDSDLMEYHNERQRQERALEDKVDTYDGDVKDYFARGGQPLITYKDWMKGKRGQGTPTPIDPDFTYTPPPDADYEPPW